ncbi:MAG: urate hydroxylase PuuD [Acidobacteria bacterium]|nr:urate hydroxylase PuuD [Acidobacteriota bacterium]
MHSLATIGLFEDYGFNFLARWGHILSGITWIGLLYYFNFVQTPAFAAFEAGPRNEAFAKLVPRAMWWFRWGAAATLGFGILLLAIPESSGDDSRLTHMAFFKSAEGVSIAAGILMALVMFLNVWLVIWPAQKRAIANAQNVLAGKEADAGLPPVMRRAATASRTNTFLSIPMLWYMAFTAHFAGIDPKYAAGVSHGSKRAVWYIVVVAFVAIAEAIALSAPPVGNAKSYHLDDHRRTIVGGVIVAVLLYVLWEGLFG